MSDTRCPACSGSKIVIGPMHSSEAYGVRFAPLSCGYPALPLISSYFHACFGCGLLWSTFDPETLRSVLRASGQEIAKQEIDEIDYGPCRDLPDSDWGRMVGASISELDKLARDGRTALLRRYRDMRGVTWDVAAMEATHWRQMTREEKLGRFGWVAKVKPPKDDLDEFF